MKEHPPNCPGDICDEYTCPSRRRHLLQSYPSPVADNSGGGEREERETPQTVMACLRCSPHLSRTPTDRCGHLNQFCREPEHKSIFCVSDNWVPKTWIWTERETDWLGEVHGNKFLFDYHKLKLNFERVAYPPTPATQWSPCNTEWQLLRNENTTMHYVGGRTRVTLRVWVCSHPNSCCTLSANGMQHGFFNYDNRNLFECTFLDLLLARVINDKLSIPGAFHALSSEFEICHDDMPGLPVNRWTAILDTYQNFPRHRPPLELDFSVFKSPSSTNEETPRGTEIREGERERKGALRREEEEEVWQSDAQKREGLSPWTWDNVISRRVELGEGKMRSRSPMKQ